MIFNKACESGHQAQLRFIVKNIFAIGDLIERLAAFDSGLLQRKHFGVAKSKLTLPPSVVCVS
jgi:hypothetical protein